MPTDQNHNLTNQSIPSTLATEPAFVNVPRAWQQEFLFYRLDLEGRLTFVSPSVENILGSKPSEMVGHKGREFLYVDHPHQHLLENLADQRSTSTGLQARLCVAARIDGAVVYLAIRERREHDARGNLIGRLGMAYDVTEHVKAELSLTQSEQKYRRLVEGLGGDYVIYTHDPDGIITYVSPSIENVLGYLPAMVIGRNWRELVGEHFVGRQQAERVEAEVAQGKRFYQFTVEISHAEGSTRLAEIQQRPLFDPEGNYLSMEGIAKDITETTRTAEELRRLKEDLEKRVADRTTELRLKNEMLRESEARYRHVVEDQTEFIVRLLPDWTYSFVNEAYCNYFDCSREQLLGKPFMPTVYEEDRPGLEQELASLTTDRPIGTIEHRVYRPDGSIGWTQWTNRALFGRNGQFEECQSVGRDITDLKNAADTIREKEAHLAHVSRLATMGELVAGIAHEVHQPLHAAKTFSEAARRNLESGRPEGIPTAIDCTKEISEAITRTAKIIRHLRAFTTAKPVKFELLDVNQVVKEAAEIIAYETRRAHVKVRFNFPSGASMVQGDRVQLEQACVNLLMNAYESMVDTPSDQREVLICIRRDHQHVSISFKDAGCGVDPVDRDRLFDAFYSTKPRGMGMGLSLCKSIAESHSGQIQADPNDGPGMTFVFTLPLSNSSLRGGTAGSEISHD